MQCGDIRERQSPPPHTPLSPQSRALSSTCFACLLAHVFHSCMVLNKIKLCTFLIFYMSARTMFMFSLFLIYNALHICSVVMYQVPNHTHYPNSDGLSKRREQGCTTGDSTARAGMQLVTQWMGFRKSRDATGDSTDGISRAPK